MKLFLASYSIGFTALSSSLVLAIVAAKTVLIVDQVGKVSKLRRDSNRYVVVLYRTALYTFVALVLNVLEKLLENQGQMTAFQGKALDHFLAVILFLTGVFLIYSVIDEVNLYLESVGLGSLRKVFLNRLRKVERATCL